MITPVGRVKHAGGEFTVAGGQPGTLTMKLREALTSIQEGTTSDPHGWMHPLR
jgi:branched-chain amino acid aminotransferase